MNNDMDAQFLCKDCSRFNQCQYYDRRKGDSYICKYFHLAETYGVTNGDVMRVLFPNCVQNENRNWVGTNIDGYTTFSTVWWNATYKKECIKTLPTVEKESCRCNTCKNNDDELSGECYECVKGIFDHYEKENKTEVENGRTND